VDSQDPVAIAAVRAVRTAAAPGTQRENLIAWLHDRSQ
jgi:hypothetical protein